jgi:hypothetical protein
MTIRPIKLPLPADLTHDEVLICMWLGSDPPLLEQMRLLVDDEPYNPVPYNYTQLSSEVWDMLYDPMYSHHPHRDLFGVMQNGGDATKAEVLRASVSKRALMDIEEDGWNRIRAALLA